MLSMHFHDTEMLKYSNLIQPISYILYFFVIHIFRYITVFISSKCKQQYFIVIHYVIYLHYETIMYITVNYILYNILKMYRLM